MSDYWCPCGACNGEGPELPEYEPEGCNNWDDSDDIYCLDHQDWHSPDEGIENDQ